MARTLPRERSLGLSDPEARPGWATPSCNDKCKSRAPGSAQQQLTLHRDVLGSGTSIHNCCTVLSHEVNIKCQYGLKQIPGISHFLVNIQSWGHFFFFNPSVSWNPSLFSDQRQLLLWVTGKKGGSAQAAHTCRWVLSLAAKGCALQLLTCACL